MNGIVTIRIGLFANLHTQLKFIFYVIECWKPFNALALS